MVKKGKNSIFLIGNYIIILLVKIFCDMECDICFDMKLKAISICDTNPCIWLILKFIFQERFLHRFLRHMHAVYVLIFATLW